jgi:hypothetical protein
MAAKERKPMTFNLNPTPAAANVPPASIPRAEGVERQQVGARVTKATYRQLKARAALSGASVQDLVEQAINDFLAKSV